MRPHIHHRETDVVVPPMLKVDKLLGESPFLNGDWLGRAAASAGGGVSARLQPGEVLNASSPWRYEYLLSFVGSVRFHTPGYSMGVRQSIFRKYNETAGFFLRDLRGDSKKGVHKQMKPHEYLGVLQRSKFCLAPSGMGFSTRSYESIAQGCVPLVIQDDPLTNTSVDQAFDELLPWRQFSVRLRRATSPPARAPRLLPRRRVAAASATSAACGHVLWLHPTTRRRASSSRRRRRQRRRHRRARRPAAAADPTPTTRSSSPSRAAPSGGARPAAPAPRLARAGRLRQGPAGRRDARRRRRRAPRVARAHRARAGRHRTAA